MFILNIVREVPHKVVEPFSRQNVAGIVAE